MNLSGVKSTLKKVSIDNLKEDIQRVEGIDERRVRKMADAFTPLALGTITISDRENGEMFVIDGRHRVAAARLDGYTGPIPAVVITGMSRAQEAELFNLLNSGKAVSAISKFVNAVIALHSDAVVMNAVIEDHGWRVSPAPDPGCLAAVSAVERIYAIGSKDLLERTIRTITEAWEWDRKSADANMLLGVAQLYDRFGSQVDDVKLIAELRDTRPGVIIGKAKALRDLQGGTISAALAKTLVGLHNKKRRTNLLPEWVWIR